MPKLLRVFTLLSIALMLVSCSRDPNVIKQKYLDSGNKYFDHGNYKAAALMYRKAISTDLKFGQAYYRLAMTSLKLKQVANSVPALRRAAELLPKGSKEWNETNLSLAEILLYAAQTTEAEARSKPLMEEVNEIIKAFLAKDPKSYEGHKLKADVLLTEALQLYKRHDLANSKSELEQSIAEYRATLATKPGDSATSLSLARALALDGQTGEAEQLYRTAIAKDPTVSGAYVELYRIYMSQKKLPEAEATLKKAIAANPKDFNFQTLLAAYYFGNGDRPSAAKVLEHMKSDLKDFPQAYFTAGDFYLRGRDGDSAIKEFEQGEKNDKAHKVDYQKRIIEVLVQQGKNAQAYEQNLAILKDNPKDPEARGMKATFLLDKGDINQAINELQAVVTARPENFVAHFQLGRAHYAKQEYEQARQQFEKALQLRQDYLPPRLALVQVALARGDYDGAVKLSQDALKVNPTSGAAKLLLAAAMMRKGDYKDSRASLETILASNPKQPETLLEAGVLNMMEKRYDDAATEFRKAYDVDPSNLRGLLGQSESYLLMGKPDEAIKVVQNEVNRFPDRNDLKKDLADIEFRTGRIDQAMEIYRALMPLYKDNPKLEGDLYARVGDGYIRKKDFTSAVGQLRKAHELEPDSTPVINTLALLLENGGSHLEARKLYEESISRKANDPEALNNLAYLMAETGGNLDEALTLATRAKQQLPNYAEISDTIGWIYLKKNLADSAVDIFRDLTAKAPQVSTYHYHYAMALLQKGDRASAQKQCQDALTAKPKDKEEEGKIHELMSKI